MPQRVAVLLALAGTGETVCVGVCQRDRARPRVLPESMGRSAHAYAYEGHGRITVPYARPRMYGAACRERAHNACTRPGPHADANANSALVACLARVVFERARVACERAGVHARGMYLRRGMVRSVWRGVQQCPAAAPIFVAPDACSLSSHGRYICGHALFPSRPPVCVCLLTPAT